ncbi:MAG: AMP-binding protein [Acidimicrobiales bacterium]|jgi:acyl-CoA synthetase (AMP-forming)/AMP-acid ligase II|nr:AMP-binding protein [Acidimicrobiales bacterium]
MPGFNLADMFEQVAAVAPDREAVVAAGRRVTYQELDTRAERLAGWLRAAGVVPGDHVGILALNCPEWLEALIAAFKVRAAAINVNHRYLADELLHLCGNADLVALVVQRRFAPRVEAIKDRLPSLRHIIVVDDDSGEPALGGEIAYEAAVAEGAHVPDHVRASRSGDDRYVMYTGGTTGLPKGVVWRHEDLFFAALRGGATGRLGPVTRPEEPAERAAQVRAPMRWLLPAPLHHAGGQWGTLSALLTGHTLIQWSGAHFDADALWRLVEQERVHSVGIIGDAMARPMADALAAPGASYDTSSLLSFGSGGAVFSVAVKEELRRLLPNVALAESLGSSESGLDAVLVLEPQDFESGARPRFAITPDMAVFDSDLRPVVPGSGVVGRIARRGHIPLGYYNDVERTARTFPFVDGVRWVIVGDDAVVDDERMVHLLGRGSGCINTGGEKVWPEEVEATLKQHSNVFDAVVVGLPDARWGQRVAAVVALRPGSELSLAEAADHCRERLADYKVPRRLRIVDAVERHASGKPDYRWASSIAAEPASDTTADQADRSAETVPGGAQ